MHMQNVQTVGLDLAMLLVCDAFHEYCKTGVLLFF